MRRTSGWRCWKSSTPRQSDDPPTTKRRLRSNCAVYCLGRGRAPRFCGSNRLHAAEQSDFAQGKQLHQTDLRVLTFPRCRAQGASALARGKWGNAKDAPEHFHPSTSHGAGTGSTLLPPTASQRPVATANAATPPPTPPPPSRPASRPTTVAPSRNTGAMSPFEVKNLLVKMAKRGKGDHAHPPERRTQQPELDNHPAPRGTSSC